MRKQWGPGIPEYTEKDIMTEQELLDFALEIVKEYEINQNGFEFIVANSDLKDCPNCIAKKDGKTYFIQVKADIAPNMPELTNKEKEEMISKSKEFNAIPMFAPVGFGAADPERFDKSLALRDDDFYSNYVGMKKILFSEGENINMSLIKCIECGKEFSDKAKACPNCGCPVEYSLDKNNKKQNDKNISLPKSRDDEHPKDEKYEFSIKVIHGIRTNMVIKNFIRSNGFKENTPLFGDNNSEFNKYYTKGRYFDYKIVNDKLTINAYEFLNYSIPIENGHVSCSVAVLPKGDFKSDVEKLVKDLKDLN